MDIYEFNPGIIGAIAEVYKDAGIKDFEVTIRTDFRGVLVATMHRDAGKFYTESFQHLFTPSGLPKDDINFPLEAFKRHFRNYLDSITKPAGPN